MALFTRTKKAPDAGTSDTGDVTSTPVPVKIRMLAGLLRVARWARVLPPRVGSEAALVDGAQGETAAASRPARARKPRATSASAGDVKTSPRARKGAEPSKAGSKKGAAAKTATRASAPPRTTGKTRKSRATVRDAARG